MKKFAHTIRLHDKQRRNFYLLLGILSFISFLQWTPLIQNFFGGIDALLARLLALDPVVLSFNLSRLFFFLPGLAPSLSSNVFLYVLTPFFISHLFATNKISYQDARPIYFAILAVAIFFLIIPLPLHLGLLLWIIRSSFLFLALYPLYIFVVYVLLFIKAWIIFLTSPRLLFIRFPIIVITGPIIFLYMIWLWLSASTKGPDI